MRKWYALAVGAVSAIMLAGSGATGAAVQVIHCGDTLAVDTTLISDLDCSGFQYGGLNLKDGVTLDMGGHTLSSVSGFAINGQTYTVRNGTITGSGIAIATYTGTVTLSHVRLIANGQGIQSLGSRVNISNSVINRNGLGLSGTTPGYYLENTTMDDNGRGAFFYQGGLVGNHVSVSNSHGDGIHIDQGVISLVNSRVTGNRGFGVYVFNSYQDPRAILVGNEVSQNELDGIYLTQLEPLSYPNQWYIANNTANSNHNYGIEILNYDGAITGYDRGGNVARGNGQPAQCLNIACSPN